MNTKKFLPLPESTSSDLMASSEEIERLTRRQMIRDIKGVTMDTNTNDIIKDPVDIEHINLDESFYQH